MTFSGCIAMRPCLRGSARSTRSASVASCRFKPKIRGAEESSAVTLRIRAWDCFVPTGQFDNSPAFQRRDACARPPVPPGRLNGRRRVSAVAHPFRFEHPGRPCGTCLCFTTNPALKCRAIVIRRFATFSSQKGFGNVQNPGAGCVCRSQFLPKTKKRRRRGIAAF